MKDKNWVFYYRFNGEWFLFQISVKKNELIEFGVNGVIMKYWEIVFMIVMQRRMLYYVMGILLFVFFLFYFNIFVFILLVELGEKVCEMMKIYQ